MISFALILGAFIQPVLAQKVDLAVKFNKSLSSYYALKNALAADKVTEAGRTALSYADQIFLLGQQLEEALVEGDSGRIRLAVGISDSLPKLTAYRLLESALGMQPPVRLVCHENEFDARPARADRHHVSRRCAPDEDHRKNRLAGGAPGR